MKNISIEVALNTLNAYQKLNKETYENFLNSYGKESPAVIDMEETIKAYEQTIKDLSREGYYKEEREAHAEVTLEMEMGKDISLAEWARKNGITPASARQKAGRGGFKTARKVGRDWVINELEASRIRKGKNIKKEC